MHKDIKYIVTFIIICVFWSYTGIAKTLNLKRDNSHAPVSHAIWDKLLKKYVDISGNVDYKGMATETKLLSQYLELLSKNFPTQDLSKDDQLAFWINTYNAYTLKLILDHYPVNSIKHIKTGAKSPWDYNFIKIGDKSYSLNNIEHDIIRKQFDEPRIHFALVCAAKSCPKLVNSAYVGKSLDKQLTAAGRLFLSDASKNIITPNAIQISELFEWYRGDFVKNGTLISFLNRFSKIEIENKATVKLLPYNWNLNEN